MTLPEPNKPQDDPEGFVQHLANHESYLLQPKITYFYLMKHQIRNLLTLA